METQGNKLLNELNQILKEYQTKKDELKKYLNSKSEVGLDIDYQPSGGLAVSFDYNNEDNELDNDFNEVSISQVVDIIDEKGVVSKKDADYLAENCNF